MDVDLIFKIAAIGILVANAARSLGMEVQTIQSAMAGVKRIDAFLAQPEREISAQRTRAARGDVELSHVTFG